MKVEVIVRNLPLNENQKREISLQVVLINHHDLQNTELKNTRTTIPHGCIEKILVQTHNSPCLVALGETLLRKLF